MVKRILVVFIVFFTSCSSVAHFKTDDVNVFSERSDETKIEVFSTKNANNREYDILGFVIADADAGDDSKKAVSILKLEASKLGADAIVNLRLSVDKGYWNSALKATGYAVKYK